MHITADFYPQNSGMKMHTEEGEPSGESSKTDSVQGKRRFLENIGYQHIGLKVVQYSDLFNSILSNNRQIRDKEPIGSTS